MTDNMTKAELMVTQADRKTLADVFDIVSNLLGDDGFGQVADLIRDGEYDEHEAMPVITRHRHAATAPQPSVEGLDPANQACLDKRRPGEPLFIILGRDPDGGNVVRLWAKRRAEAGDCTHALPVLKLAGEMDAYAADPANAPETAPDKSAYAALSPATHQESALRDALFSIAETTEDERSALIACDALSTVPQQGESELRELLVGAILACEHPVMFPQLARQIRAALASGMAGQEGEAL